MALMNSKIAAALTFGAALSMASMPAHAAELPRNNAITPATVYDADAQNVARHRYYRWGRHHRGPRTGDVIAGILVLGTIAAIASSAKNNRERTERYPSRYPYPEDRNYREPRRDSYRSGGIGSAIDMCIDEVERMRGRVERVENASRRGDGWHVDGELSDGDSFTCQIDNDGRIEDVRLGGAAAYRGADASGAIDGDVQTQGEQWDDESYARARREASASSASSDTTERQPAYPGGLYEGESGAGEDGRYSLADAPEFTES